MKYINELTRIQCQATNEAFKIGMYTPEIVKKYIEEAYLSGIEAGIKVQKEESRKLIANILIP